MDLHRMLEKCRRGQWQTEDLDWSQPAPAMPPDKEMAVVQYFTDMAGIERLAAALFEEQQAAAEDPVLADIFATFVEDEKRHARAAELLAAHYDVNRLRQYRQSSAMRKFSQAFLDALPHATPETVAFYVTAGELVLDVALLRSIDAYVDDKMSSQVMERINRDESRHIAMDFYMAEYYAAQPLATALGTRLGPRRQLAATVALLRVLHYARPFFQDVFAGPMERTDPSGQRLIEALSRFQRLIERPQMARRPLPALVLGAQSLARAPRTARLAKPVAEALGIPDVFLRPELSRDRRTPSAPAAANPLSNVA